ncbi:MAG: NnrU family protein [Hyphomicrobiaceae bacterium]
MTWFLAGLILFFAVHLLPIMPDLRSGVRDAVGGAAYRGLFSLISLVGLVLIVIGYGDLRTSVAANPELWSPPTWTRHVAFLLMIPSMILLVSAYVPNRIRDAVGHPMLAAIKIWAFAHLLANGDLASVILFASFLAYAVIDRISVKRRNARGPVGDKAGGLSGDVTVVGVGLLAYAAILFFAHEWLIGIPLIAT